VILRVLSVLRVFALFFCIALANSAQAYPDRLIRIVVPLPPGGSNDVVARMIAEKLSAGLGQPAVVENRPGASGNIGTELVAKSVPDGHTLLMANTAHVINPSLFAKLSYDPIRDFAPVSLTTSVHFALVVHPSLPASSVKGFVALARARPGTVTFASAGNGAPHHLAMALLQSMTGAKLTHVPYKGAGQFVPALVAGEVVSVIGAINSLLPHVKSGRLRALGMAGPRRTPLLPGVPAIAETLPGFALDNWGGVLAPAATPRAVVERLNSEIVKMLRDPQVTERLVAQGIEVTPSTPAAFQDLMRSHLAKWSKVVAEAGVKLE